MKRLAAVAGLVAVLVLAAPVAAQLAVVLARRTR